MKKLNLRRLTLRKVKAKLQNNSIDTLTRIINTRSGLMRKAAQQIILDRRS